MREESHLQHNVNKIYHCTVRGVQLAGSWIPILLYTDDIALITESLEGFQCHLDTLHSFAQDSELLVDIGKTKLMVFNTTSQFLSLLNSQCMISCMDRKG